MKRIHPAYKTLLAVVVLGASSLAISTSVSASGGGGFSGGSESTQSRSSASGTSRSNQDESTPGGFSFKQRIDQQYELGKAYFKAPVASGARLEYCVQTSDGLKKLSRKS